MKKKIIILIMLLLTLPNFSQNFKEQNSTKDNNTNQSTIGNDSLLKNPKETINFKSDSLEKELLFYKVKEDFYTAALSDQANRFTLIITGILALFAVISFGAFKYEVLKIREETDFKLKKNKKEIENYKKQLSETNIELTGAKANLSTSIAKYFEKENDHVSAFFYYLSAAKSHGESKWSKNVSESEEPEKKPFDVCLINLDFAIDCLNKITTTKEKTKLKLKLNSVNKIMDYTHNFDNHKVKKNIAKIRIAFLTLIE
jgi:hypothetical protein